MVTFGLRSRWVGPSVASGVPGGHARRGMNALLTAMLLSIWTPRAPRGRCRSVSKRTPEPRHRRRPSLAASAGASHFVEAARCAVGAGEWCLCGRCGAGGGRCTLNSGRTMIGGTGSRGRTLIGARHMATHGDDLGVGRCDAPQPTNSTASASSVTHRHAFGGLAPSAQRISVSTSRLDRPSASPCRGADAHWLSRKPTRKPLRRGITLPS